MDIKVGDKVFSRKYLHAMRAAPMLMVVDISEDHDVVYAAVDDMCPTAEEIAVGDVGTALQEGETAVYEPKSTFCPNGMVFYDRECAQRVKDREAPPDDFYRECMEPIDPDDLDPIHDSEDAINCLVTQFVRRNQFKDLMDVLQDVTPNHWRAQVNRAAKRLETALYEAMEDVERDMHDGQFVGNNETHPELKPGAPIPSK